MYLIYFLFFITMSNGDIYYKSILFQDKLINATYKTSFKNALSHCESLESNGMKLWRLPTQAELLLIVDKNRIPTVKQNFNYSNVGCYWSYTNGKIGSIDFQEGKVDNIIHVDRDCFVRCVYKK